jgi:hypothetical protein
MPCAGCGGIGNPSCRLPPAEALKTASSRRRVRDPRRGASHPPPHPESLGDFDGFAALPPPGKVPVVWEAATLRGLHRLNQAHVPSLQKETLAIRLVDDRQARPIRIQPRTPLDEVRLAHAQKLRNPRRLVLRDPYITRPPATVAASLAQVSRLLVVKQGCVAHRNFTVRHPANFMLIVPTMSRRMQAPFPPPPCHHLAGRSTLVVPA